MALDTDPSTDGALLEAFASRHDEAAFEAVLRRHAGMVLNVCRHILGHTQDSEDAAQAVFLVLARKAASLSGAASVGPWLHHVATQVAQDAARARSATANRERKVVAMHAPAADTPAFTEEQKSILDTEIDALPEKYRRALVLFHLEGCSLEQTATAMGCPLQTANTWLIRGREALKSRLLRRGAVFSAGVLVAALSAEAGAAEIPATFLAATTQAAGAVATGKIAAGGVVSAKVAALTQGALHMLFMAKVKMAAMLVGALFVMASATGVVAYKAMAQDAPPPKHGSTTAENRERITITGIAKALIDASDKKHFNPSIASATVTTKDANGKANGTIYHVYGWAGIICAINDGKLVEVNGYPGEKEGEKTITGKSIDVKIIVVEEK